jgi:hypothetical protein
LSLACNAVVQEGVDVEAVKKVVPYSVEVKVRKSSHATAHQCASLHTVAAALDLVLQLLAATCRKYNVTLPQVVGGGLRWHSGITVPKLGEASALVTSVTALASHALA